MPENVRSSFREPLPMHPAGAERAYADFVEKVRPYPNGNLHPRFWGWVQGTGTPLAMLADMLASALVLNMVCFRFREEHSAGEDLNSINQEILLRLQESGIAVPSGTTLDGKFAIRVAITNHRSQRGDFDTLVAAVMQVGKDVAATAHS